MGFDGAAFQFAGRESGARRRAPEVPDFIRPAANAEHDRVAFVVIIQGHRFVLIGSEPWITLKKPATQAAPVFVEDEIFAICSTRELLP